MTKDLKAIASALAGSKVSEVIPARRGGNSRVYMVATQDRLYALKSYPEIQGDVRHRLEVERQALQWMHAYGISNVPVFHGAVDSYALFDWIDGYVITDPKESDIDEAAVFLGTLHHLSQKTVADAMPMASEACISGQEIIDQLERRVARLMPYTKENPALMKFLSQQFLPTFTKRFMTLKKQFPKFVTPLVQQERTLIPADFGFHNMMRNIQGRVHFIDFEYFGWDDPVKLICDVLLHPGTQVSTALQQYFLGHALAIYGENIRERLMAYYPLFGLRWTLILLNDFLPERWAAKQQAGVKTSWQEVKTAQLAKAESMMRSSERCEAA